MNIGQKSFLFFIFFIFGVLLSGFGMPLALTCMVEGAVFLLFLFAYFLKSNTQVLAIGFLTLVILAGAIYERTYEYIKFESTGIQYNQKVRISGAIDSYPLSSEKTKAFVFKMDSGRSVYVRTDYFQPEEYGDEAEIEGVIKPLEDKTDYLKKYGVVGTIDYPKFISLSAGSGAFIKKYLYNFRDLFASVFQRTLNSKESALMAGILLGQESANFPADFKQAMKNSGTTHITALSGYNITILIVGLYFILSFVFSRRATFWASITGIILFVVMTGAQSSVIRAAFMGGLVILARHLSRVYSFKQAMAVSAFVMILFNPMILRFDLGFILSFLSLAGMTYLAPIADSFITFKKEWLQKTKNIFFETFCAQAAVLPILIVYFGGFSAVGVISNILILPLIPFTMFIGFITGLLGIIWTPIAQMFSVFLSLPLKFEVGVIDFFGSFNQIQASFGIIILTLYYILLTGFILKFRHRLEAKEYAV